MVSGISGLEKLTHQHAVTLSAGAGVPVEECSLAVGAVVGYGITKFASRVNATVVIFVNSIDKVNQLVENGVLIQRTLTLVFFSGKPGKKSYFQCAPSVRNENIHIQWLKKLLLKGHFHIAGTKYF